MPRIYTAKAPAFTPGGAGAQTLWECIAGANKPVRLKRVELSSDNVSGTLVTEIQINRISATGTGTALTAKPGDDNDAAAAVTCKTNDTVEPTVALADLWGDEWNLQVPYIWIAGPGEEWRASPTNGFAIKWLTHQAQNVVVAVSLEED